MLSYVAMLISLIAIIVAIYFLYVALQKPKEKFSSKVLVEYVFAPCTKFTPIWESVASQLSKEAYFKKIDGTIAENKTLEIMSRVRGFPYVQKTVDGRVTEFSGTRDESSLKAFVRGEK
jgi:hypothetical protein